MLDRILSGVDRALAYKLMLAHIIIIAQLYCAIQIFSVWCTIGSGRVYVPLGSCID